jgi:hypothetical protein
MELKTLVVARRWIIGKHRQARPFFGRLTNCYPRESLSNREAEQEWVFSRANVLLARYAQVGGLDRKKLGLYVIRASISQSRAIITVKASIQIINIPWKASSRGTNTASLVGDSPRQSPGSANRLGLSHC